MKNLWVWLIVLVTVSAGVWLDFAILNSDMSTALKWFLLK